MPGLAANGQEIPVDEDMEPRGADAHNRGYRFPLTIAKPVTVQEIPVDEDWSQEALSPRIASAR